MKMEKILLFEVGRESFPDLAARACLNQIGDVVVEAPQLWNPHAQRSGPQDVVANWSVCHLSVV